MCARESVTRLLTTQILLSGDLRTGPLELFVDKVFANEINRYVRSSEECYEKMNFRDVVVSLEESPLADSDALVCWR